MRIALLILMLLLQTSPLFALRLSGTGDSEVLLQRLATEYQRLYPERKVDVPPSVSSSGGIRLLLEGRTDIARVARPLRGAEVGQDLVWREFARAPILFVANLPESCVSDLSSQQVLDIFSGRIKRWSLLGACPDHNIYLARRELGDASNLVLNDNLPGFRQLKNMAGKTIYTTAKTVEVIDTYPFTLGYLPLNQVQNTTLTLFSFNGISATAENVRSGDYPLHMPLALVWKLPLSREAQDFINFLNSPKAQQLTLSFGAIPATIENF